MFGQQVFQAFLQICNSRIIAFKTINLLVLITTRNTRNFQIRTPRVEGPCNRLDINNFLFQNDGFGPVLPFLGVNNIYNLLNTDKRKGKCHGIPLSFPGSLCFQSPKILAKYEPALNNKINLG